MSDSPTYDLTTAAGQRAHYAASRARIFNAKPKLRENGHKRRSDPFIPPEERFGWARRGQKMGPFYPTQNAVLALLFLTGQVLEPLPSPIPETQIVSEVIHLICERYNVSKALLMSIGRSKSLAWPRHIAIYLAHDLTALSSVAIVRRFGRTDHTTAINSLKRVKERMAEDPAFAAEVEGLKRELTGAK